MSRKKTNEEFENISIRIPKGLHELMEEKVNNGSVSSISFLGKTILKAHFKYKNNKNNKNNTLTSKPKIIKINKRLSRKELKENKEKFEPLLKTLGAKFIKKGVYELKGFLCYPSTKRAMNKLNNEEKFNLEEFIKKCN